MSLYDPPEQRLTQLMQHANVSSLNALADFLHLSHNIIYAMKKGRANFTKKTCDAFLAKIPDLNLDWLLTGRGQMLISQQEENQVSEKTLLYAHKQNSVVVPILTRSAKEGYLQDMNTESFVKQLKMMYLPFPELRGREVIAFPVEGQSMAPKLEDGDLVVAFRVYDLHDIKDMRNIYAVVLHEVIVIKYVQPYLNEGVMMLRLISQNYGPDYGDMHVKAEDVREVWQVYRKFSPA